MSILERLQRAFGRARAREGRSEAAAAADDLTQVVSEALEGCDEVTRRVATAAAGLLGAVAHADGSFSSVEEELVREELLRLQGVRSDRVDMIVEVLRSQRLQLATSGDHRWIRDLRELAEVALRKEILETMMGIAAGDEELTPSETDYLRRVAVAMGLSSSDYEAAQAQHREHLTVLRAHQ